MAAAAILDCRIHIIVSADSGRRAQTHHFTKFRKNWSFHFGDVAIFLIFKMAAATILDFEIAKFYWLLGWRGLRRISMPNFVKIGQLVVKILRFFVFLKMAAAAIFDFRNRVFLFADVIWRAQTHHCTKFYQNRLFSCGDIAIFRIFKVAAAAMLDF